MRSIYIWIALGALAGCRTAPASAPAAPTPQNTETPSATALALPQPNLAAREVRRLLVEAAKKTPTDPHLSLEVILLDLRAGLKSPTEVEQELIALWKRYPKSGRIPYQLALLYIQQNRLPQSLEPLKAAAEIENKDAQVQSIAAQMLMQAGEETAAIRYAEAAKRLAPDLAAPYLTLAQANDHHGTALKAIDYAKAYVERAPNPSAGLYMIGRTYARQADGPNAELWLKKALESDPKRPEIWLTLGRVYYEMFRSTRAQEGIQHFQKALELQPNYGEAHLWMGRARLNEGKPNEAIPHFEQALRNSPQPGPIYYDLGQALIKAGRVDEGNRMLATYREFRTYTDGITKRRIAISQSPRSRALRLELAQFCIQHKQYRGAIAVIRDLEKELGADAKSKALLSEALKRADQSASTVPAPVAGDLAADPALKVSP